MTDQSLSFFARLALAFATFFRVLGDGRYAARLALPEGPKEPPPPPPAPAAPKLETSDERAALQLLALLQREGRFLDFLEEDIAGFGDAQVGAAARAVHDGCKKVLRDHLPLEPVRSEAEGARVTVERGFDASAIRLVGNVRGEGPFAGTLVHRGIRVASVNLPKLAPGHDARVLQPAEVEL